MTEENVFQRVIGCVIANRISYNYNGLAETEFRAINKPYLANKLRDAWKAEEKLLNVLKITDKTIDNQIENMATMYSDFITEILELSDKNQLRVKGLVEKLRAEERKSNQS